MATRCVLVNFTSQGAKITVPELAARGAAALVRKTISSIIILLLGKDYEIEFTKTKTVAIPAPSYEFSIAAGRQ